MVGSASPWAGCAHLVCLLPSNRHCYYSMQRHMHMKQRQAECPLKVLQAYNMQSKTTLTITSKSFGNFRHHFLKINFRYNVCILTSTATHSAKLIGCYSTNGIMEVKTSHLQNCFDCQTGYPSPMHARQQWSSTATHMYFFLQVCTLTSFLTFEPEVSPSSGPAGCSGWEWHTCSAKCYENNVPTCQKLV